MNEVIIKRPDLGSDPVPENKVTVAPLAFKYVKQASRLGNSYDRSSYIVAQSLRLDGKEEPEPMEFYDEMDFELYGEFFDAYVQLVPYERRVKIGVLTNEEEAKILRELELEHLKSKEPKKK